MAQICRTAKCVEAIRVALLDPCTLLPVAGAGNGYAMGCIIDFNMSKEIEDGEESIIKDDCGRICARDKRSDQTKFHTVEFKIKEPDAEFLSLISGDPLIVDGGNSIGVRELANGDPEPYVFLEAFERAGDECDPETGDPLYYRHVWPAIRLTQPSNEKEGIFRILNIEGETKDVLTSIVANGPYNDIPTAYTTPGSASERMHYTWFVDDVVPTVQCGSITVPAQA